MSNVVVSQISEGSSEEILVLLPELVNRGEEMERTQFFNENIFLTVYDWQWVNLVSQNIFFVGKNEWWVYVYP